MSLWYRLLRLLPHATPEPMTLEDVEDLERRLAKLRQELRAIREILTVDKDKELANAKYKNMLQTPSSNNTH